MAQCEVCKKPINDGYKYCIPCLNKIKEGNREEGKNKIFEQINWNLGSLSKWSKLSLLNDLEKNKQRTPIQENIHKLLIKDIVKDFKAIENITKEQDGIKTPNKE